MPRAVPLLLAALALVLATCTESSEPPAPVAPKDEIAVPAPVFDAAPPTPTDIVTAEAIGPVRLGDGAETLATLDGVRREASENPGVLPDHYDVYRDGTHELRVRVDGDRITEVLVLAGDWHTAEGARLGMTAAEIVALYGDPADVGGSEGETCATCATLPDVELCFDIDTVTAPWKRVVAQKRPLSAIRIPARKDR
jgi:hypothetical protein